jgi:hypothetical protein
VHNHRARLQWNDTLVKDDLARSHVPDVSHAYDVLDGAEQIELPDTEGWCLCHRGNDAGVDPKHHAGSLEAQEQVVERVGLGGRRHGVRCKPDRHRRIGLDNGAIEHPGLTRPDPNDPIWPHTVRQQPDDPVGRGLSGSDDDVAARRVGQRDELVDGNDVNPVSNAERRGCRRRDRW